MTKYLGKIQKVTFGINGSQLGLHLHFSLKGSSVGTTFSAWDAESIKRTERSKWTEEDRDKQYSEIMRKLSKLLSDAKVDSVDELEGKPVEVTLDGFMFGDFRILTEVL